MTADRVGSGSTNKEPDCARCRHAKSHHADVAGCWESHVLGVTCPCPAFDSGVGAVPADEPTDELHQLRIEVQNLRDNLASEGRRYSEAFVGALQKNEEIESLRGRLAAVTELPDKLEADPPIWLLSPHNAHNAATWLREQLSVLGVPGEQ